MADGKEARLFSAYKIVPQDNTSTPTDPIINAYLIESTALNNIDDSARIGIRNEEYDAFLKPLEVSGKGNVIDAIAKDPKASKNPTLAISIHGFNNPRDSILRGIGSRLRV